MKEEFKLYYKDMFLGTVFTDATDFPSTSGKIEFNSDTLEVEKELQDYIDFSIQSSDKVLRDNDDYEQFIDKEESNHQSIIDSLDWTLVSKDEAKAKILVPVFFSGNGINFRFQ